MNDQLTDIIRSFIGYWHMDDLTAKMPVKLIGTPYPLQELDDAVALTSDNHEISHTKFDDLPAAGETELFSGSAQSLLGVGKSFVEVSPLKPVFTNASFAKKGAASQPDNTPAPAVQYGQGYPTIADQTENIFANQQNNMVDNDHIVFEGLENVDIEFDVDANAIIEDKVQEAAEATAELIDNPFQSLTPSTFVDPQSPVMTIKYDLQPEDDREEPSYSTDTGTHLQTDGAEQTEDDQNTAGDDDTPETHAYENDLDTRLEEHASRPETEIEQTLEADRDAAREQSPQDDAPAPTETSSNDATAADASTDVISADDSSNDVNQPVETDTTEPSAAPDNITTETATGPGPEIEQNTSTGHNLATNNATIIEISDGHGSLIVEGDYHEVNTIVQVNILNDNDDDHCSEERNTPNAERSDTDGNGTLRVNDAEFESSTNELHGLDLYGPAVQGRSWNIDRIEGDYYDVTNIHQQNILVDNDLILQTHSRNDLTLSTGDNLQINSARVLSYSDSYDLVIVQGNYYEFNTIVQTNIIIDNDNISMNGNSAAGGADATDLDSGGNILVNQARIHNVGGEERFSPTNDAVDTLFEQVENNADELGDDLAALLPGNGGVEINVLFIEGDFFDLTMITQINIVLDLDSFHLFAPEEYGFGEAGHNAEISTGDNTTYNTATIIDVDSPSSFQHLGGEYYEDTFLIQADIFEDDEQVQTGHPDEIGDETVVLLTEDTAQPQETDQQQYQESASGFDSDILGGIIS